MNRRGVVTLWSFGLLLLGIMGCEKYVLCLHPLHTPEVQEFEADLVGKWFDEDGVWEFSQDEDGHYAVRMAQPFALGRFRGTLLALAGKHYLNLEPTAEPHRPQTTGYYDAHFLSTHSIFQINRVASGFQLSRLSVDPLKEMLEEDPDLVSCVPHGNHLLLTADTAALQSFVQGISDNNDLWESTADLKRCPRLYEPSHIVTQDHFAGKWQLRDPNEDEGTLVITPGENRRYDIRFLPDDEKDEALHFWAALVQIDGLTLLGGFCGEAPDLTLPDWFALVGLQEKTLGLQFVTYAIMQEMLRDRTLALADPHVVFVREEDAAI